MSNATPINKGRAPDLSNGGFLDQQRNCVLVGGTGAGCICAENRGGSFDIVERVIRLETGAQRGRPGRLPEYLERMDFISLDELGSPPLARIWRMVVRMRVRR